MQTQQDEVFTGRFSAIHQPAAFSRPKSRHGGTAKIRCPHCQSIATVRTSRDVTPIFREIRLQCTDIDCGGTYVATMTIDRMIAPSMKPNPRVKLRQGYATPRTPANDDDPSKGVL